jgi:hypothetical protein
MTDCLRAMPACIALPLQQLLAAHEYASELAKDPWQFAVELQSLRAAGLTNSDLRWLVCQGYVAHAVEETQTTDAGRVFHPAPNLALDERSCFILTLAGLALAQNQLPHESVSPPAVEPMVVGPHWDGDHRVLYWHGRPLKRYHCDAPNQECVLSVFQAHRWSRSVEVALPDDGGGSYKERLHDAIKNLNRSVRPVLHFRHSGTLVTWEQGKQLP